MAATALRAAPAPTAVELNADELAQLTQAALRDLSDRLKQARETLDRAFYAVEDADRRRLRASAEDLRDGLGVAAALAGALRALARG